jgi:hypothetical protein
LQLLLIAAIAVFITSCEDELEVNDPPVITEVRNYAASPEDTLVQTINTGQWVVLLGNNLMGVSGVYFAGIPASINNALFADGSIVVQVPSIPFESVPADALNEITIANEKGAFIFNISILGEPVISRVRNFDSAPNDTILNAVFPGQQINIIGFNLEDATGIAFQGIAADLSNIIYTDTSAIVQVPEDLSGGDATLANTISYTTTIGTANYEIKIVGPPVILSVSNENPNEGDIVYLKGDNFTSIQSLTFAGEEISSFTVSEDGTIIEFIVPSLAQSGPVEITTLGGTFTSAFNVNDIATGAISNFEWDGAFRWDWWGGASLAVEDQALNEGWIGDYPEFSGNSSKFLALIVASLPAGGGADWSTAIRITGGNAAPWFPSVDNLSDQASTWALKFEVNISENWNGGTLVIRTTNGDYMVRYEPWQVSPTRTVDFKTDGWQTVSIPLNSFRRNDATLGDGKGAPIVTVNELFNTGSTTGDLLVYVRNYGTGDTKTGFRGAFDNFRVVRR